MSQERRLAKNRESKDAAVHDRELWTADEVALLLTWDRTDAELTVMGEVLGRTREACRERYYLELRRPTKTVTRKVETTETTITYYYGNWNPDDRSEWFV